MNWIGQKENIKHDNYTAKIMANLTLRLKEHFAFTFRYRCSMMSRRQEADFGVGGFIFFVQF